jgi:hypothetical protein
MIDRKRGAIMPSAEKEEMKSIKIAAHTHAYLSVLSTAVDKTISEVIDDLLEKAYPELIGEMDKVLSDMESVRGVVEKPGSDKKRNKK